MRDPDPTTRDPGQTTRDPDPRVDDPDPTTRDPHPTTRDPGPNRRKTTHARSPSEPREGSSPDTGDELSHAITLVGVRALFRVTGPVDVDGLLSEICARQRGLVTRRQLLSAGVSSATIDTLVSRRRLHRIHAGVYSLAPAGVEIPHQRETAAVLAIGDPVALCGLTAAALWKLGVHEKPGEPVHVVVPAHRDPRRPDVRVHRVRRVTQHDIRQVQGLPVTSPERTLLDIATLDWLSERQLERALDEALALRVTSTDKLTTLIAGSRGRRGRARLARLLAQRQGSTVTRSHAEERFLELIRAAGLPTPQMQAAIAGFTVDAYWPQARFVVEIDGYQWHAVFSNFDRDRRKDRALQRLGIQVSRVTWGQMEDEAMQLIAEIATTLALRMRAVVS